MKVRDILRSLPTLIIVLTFFALIISGMLVPIYADEVSTKMTQATVFENGGSMLTAIPQCFPELTMRIPITWYPAAGIYQLLYSGVGPLMIRVSGIAIALLFVGIAAFGIKRLAPAGPAYASLLAGFTAILGLGVLPLTLVLSRSEQWLLLLLAYFIFFPLLVKRVHKQSSMLLYAALFVVCVSLFFYTHSKSAFFFPVVVISALAGFRGNRWMQVTTVLFTLICLTQTILAGGELFKCDGAPVIAAGFAAQTVSVGSLIATPVQLINLFSIYLDTFPEKIINHAIFQTTYQSNWLPSVASDETLSYLTLLANQLLVLSLKAVIFYGLVLPPIVVVLALFRRAANRLHALLGALWFSLLAHLAIYVNWNFYGGVLVFGVMALLIILSMLDTWQSKPWRALGAGLLVAISGVFLLSAFTLWYDLGPRLMKARIQHAAYGVSGQALSVPTFDYPLQRAKIREFAASCGVDGDNAHRLVIDDLTYFAFERLHEPLHLSYISEKGMGQDIKGENLITFLRRMNSPGVVAQCRMLPDAVHGFMVQQENLCCINLK